MLNRVMLIGRLGADPEVRYIPSGDSITTIRLATTRSWKDRNTNERKEEVEWHRVVFFGGLAKIVGEYLKKGSQVYVEGRIHTKKWQGKDGQDKYATEIIAESMNMLGGKSEGNQRAQAPASETANPVQQNNQPDYDYDDDIPF